jgi:hypothetical protein
MELHAGTLELKAKVGIMQVCQSLIISAYHDIQGSFDAERTTARV